MFYTQSSICRDESRGFFEEIFLTKYLCWYLYDFSGMTSVKREKTNNILVFNKSQVFTGYARTKCFSVRRKIQMGKWGVFHKHC